jgi:hypothetical protein
VTVVGLFAGGEGRRLEAGKLWLIGSSSLSDRLCQVGAVCQLMDYGGVRAVIGVDIGEKGASL